MRLTATFMPQVWVNDYVIQVDPEGEVEWDCTAYVLRHIECAGVNEVTGFRYLFRGAGGYDDRDWIRDDPNAPEWVRDWSGPFEVELEGYEEFLAYWKLDGFDDMPDEELAESIKALQATYPFSRPSTEIAPASSRLLSMLQRLLECAELNQDDLEPETQTLIEKAEALLHELDGSA